MQATTEQTLPKDGNANDSSTIKDQTFETLSSPRRRQVLQYLRMHSDEEVVLIRALSEQIAAWENDVSIPEVTYKQRKRVYTSLYQSHLPKLHKYGFITYDADRGTVSPTPLAKQLEIYLEVVPGGELPWSDVYFGISMTAVLLVVAIWIGAVPFVTSWHALVMFVLALAVTSTVHSIQTRRSAMFTH